MLVQEGADRKHCAPAPYAAAVGVWTDLVTDKMDVAIWLNGRG